MKKIIYLLIILHCTLFIENCICQWLSDLRLTNTSSPSYTNGSGVWCVAANGNFVHVVWYEDGSGLRDVYYKRSADGGTNWGTAVRLSIDFSNSWYPSLAVSGSVVHIIWHGFDSIYSQTFLYKRSVDNGANFDGLKSLTHNYSLYTGYASLSASGPNVGMVWIDNNPEEVYFKRSLNNGINWLPDQKLTNNTTNKSDPTISISGSNIHILWVNELVNDLYYKRSLDNGVNWGADTRLTNSPGVSVYPSVASSGSFIHSVWSDYRDGNYEIYYKRSSDNGSNWGNDVRLTNNSASSFRPSVAYSGQLVHVIWEDNRDGNYEIFYKRSTDNGTNWSTDTRLTSNSSISKQSFVCVSGSAVHAVWTDNRDGNYEIYYKKNPTGNVGIKNIGTAIPEQFSLSQNYPNPFNQSTIINFRCPLAGNVKINVFDVTGKEVKELVNEKLQPGTYQINFDAAELPSGIYFYTLKSNEFSETKKMILIK
jgi:hypothetical protein